MSRFFVMSLMLTTLLTAPPALGGALRQAAESKEDFIEQEPPVAGSFTFNLGVGVVFPLFETNSRFKEGWGFLLGAGYHLTERISLHAEYQYSDYDVKEGLLADTSLSGDHIMQYGDLNLLIGVAPKGRLGLYITGGPGLYYRKVELTQFAGAALVPVCDPWLLFCTSDVVPVDTVIGSRSTTDFGLNGGVGVSYRVYGPMRVYLEARYHYIFGPEYDTPTGSRRANGQYLPINLGVRF
ncbi:MULTISPECIES: outer membrane beta-barrel protein [Myxococcus]|uniref:Porin family protein n=1 Tax=Myxococcus llanfairpwllgwyngyllgogerychwyrndrobwllllantysiliogogogochensis TaxID=2590453 RepID=A0A540X425_9BACT|nr:MULTISPECIES: outer membrane beta-barrel protein [Myxococcus]NTX06801.1 porin family protein [Myxococcus sp. CA040A]TQF16003.1 porin family protein [Myxococcus llanfairpwllgwyngyllgogerychwyrndrobwllllantysiliogogogochensis]